MVARRRVSCLFSALLWSWCSASFGQGVSGEDPCLTNPGDLACCEPAELPCGIQDASDCRWAEPPDPTDAAAIRLVALGIRLDGDIRDALGQGGRCLRTPACSPESSSACARSLFRSRRGVARLDRISQFNDDVDPGPFGVEDSPLLASGHGDGFGVKSGFQVSCPILWFAPDSNATDGADDSFLYLAWDLADLRSLADPEDLVTPVPFDGDGNGSACFGSSVTLGDNRDERYEVHLRTCADLKQFDPRNRDTGGLLNQFEIRLANAINGLAKDPSQTWLHTEISTPLRALAFRDYGRLHRRVMSFPTADGLLHLGDLSPTNPGNGCIQAELNACRREVMKTCRLSGRPCASDADCPPVEFCDGKDGCPRVESCFYNNNNVEMVIKRVETSGLLGPHHGRCRKTGRDCRIDASNARLCPRVGAHDPLCCDVNDAGDVCDEIAPDGAEAKRNRMALSRLAALFRADTDEDAAAEEEAVLASFTSVPGVEVEKTARCAGRRLCAGTPVECKSAADCLSGVACVDAPFTHEVQSVAPGAVLEFEIAVRNTGNEDLDVTIRDLLEEVDLDPMTGGVQTLSRCDVVCGNTCATTGVACDAAHPCANGDSCVPAIRAFLTSPRRSFTDLEVTTANAERPPICSADRSQCLVAAFFAPTCTGKPSSGGLLDAIAGRSEARLGTLLGAQSVRTGDACTSLDGDSLRVRIRVQTGFGPETTPDLFCASTPTTAECRNRVSVDGRIVEPVFVRKGEALGTCRTDSDCDDGLICNGAETCGVGGQCRVSAAGVEFCPRAAVCNALEDPCRFPQPGETVPVYPPASTLGSPCQTDASCDDGKLCNGVERCRGGICVAGPPACASGLMCDERNSSGDAWNPCGLVVATDGAGDTDSVVDIDLLCRNVELVKEVGFPACPCSFTAGATPLSLGRRCDGVDPSPSNCCCGHDAPGCKDAACRSAVCSSVPTCCSNTWTVECARLAGELCTVCASAVASADPMDVRVLSDASMAVTSPSSGAASGPGDVPAGGVIHGDSIDGGVTAAAGTPFMPLTIQYRLTATNRGEVPESITLRDDDLCEDLKSAAAAKPGNVLVSADCAICPPPNLSPMSVGPVSLLPGEVATTTCTLTVRSEVGLATFLHLDEGTCVGGDRSGTLCATAEDCPGGECRFPSCDGEGPIRSADGEECYRNCGLATVAGDNPWMRPVSLSETAAATICLHPCELNVCKQVRCLEDCDVNRPGPWYSERACARHPEICCAASADCPEFDPQNPTAPGSEQCVEQAPLMAAPGGCLQYRIRVTIPPDSDAELCAMELEDTWDFDGGSVPFARGPYDVTLAGRRCDGFPSPPEPPGSSLPMCCKFLPVEPGGVAPLRAGESVTIQYRADLKAAALIGEPFVPVNHVSVRAQRSEDGCEGNCGDLELACSGDSEVSVHVKVCGFEVRKDVTCDEPRDGLVLRPEAKYGAGNPIDVLPGTQAWFRIDFVNTGSVPVIAFDVADVLANSVGDGCTESWFVPGSVVASIDGDDVTHLICTDPPGNCDEFADLSGHKDFTTRPIESGDLLVITYAVDQPAGAPPFSHRGTEPPEFDCRNEIRISGVIVDLSDTCANGNPCVHEDMAAAEFNIKVPQVGCDKAVCVNRNNDEDCTDAGDAPFATSIHISPPSPPVTPDPRFPLTVVYRLSAKNVQVAPGGAPETELASVTMCDARLAGSLRDGTLTCVGGTRAGKLCRNDADCPGTGAKCGDARCRGGTSDGAVCAKDLDCPAGVCVAPACVGGGQNGSGCRVDGDCPGGTCRAPLEVADCVLVEDGFVTDCADVGGLGTGPGDTPPDAASRACNVRFNRLTAWERFGGGDGAGGSCDRACYRNEVTVEAHAATGTCDGGTATGRPCASAGDCPNGRCERTVCGAAEVESSRCTTEVCIEPSCEIEVTEEARCLPDCMPLPPGDDTGWVQDPEKLPAVPGACIEYRMSVCNVSQSGIRICRLELSDEMLVDGARGNSDFVGGPISPRLVGRACQGVDFSEAFNWDGQAVTCILQDATAPQLSAPLQPGDCVRIEFSGALRPLAPGETIDTTRVITNHFDAQGDGTCTDRCADDRSVAYSCADAEEVSLSLQACLFTMIYDEGCPEDPSPAASMLTASLANQRGEGPIVDPPPDCEGTADPLPVLPGSTTEVRLHLMNTGKSPIDEITIECGPTHTCPVSWFGGAIKGQLCDKNDANCKDVALCVCSGGTCTAGVGVCGGATYQICLDAGATLIPTSLPAAGKLHLVLNMTVPEEPPRENNAADCMNQFQLQAGTPDCSPPTGCGIQCMLPLPVDVLRPQLDCAKEICVDLDGNGECDGDFRSFVDLGSTPPAPFNLIYRFRVTNTGETDLANVSILDSQFRTNAEPYVVTNKCDLDPGTGRTAPGPLLKGGGPHDSTCSLRFLTLDDFEAFANADGRPNTPTEICYTNTATTSAEVVPPPEVCPSTAIVPVKECSAEVCTRVCPPEEPCPPTTTVVIDVFNQNESKFSGIERCIHSWDNRRLAAYVGDGVPNYFWREALGTDKGTARIDGVAGGACGKESAAVPLLGVASKMVLFTDDRSSHKVERTGLIPVGLGAQAGTIWYDVRAGGGVASEAREDSPEESATVAGDLGNDTPVGGIPRLGSLLVFPKIELKWNIRNELIQDTFLDVANNSDRGVYIQGYLVESLLCGVSGHGFNLTKHQPVYWSAAKGHPRFAAALTSLGDGCRDDDPRNPGGRVLRGYLVFWAVDAETLREIRWNSLKGDALIVNYHEASAWEYEAWAFQALAGLGSGSLLRAPFGQLDLDGVEYEAAPDELLLDFYSVGTRLGGPGTTRRAEIDTELTLWTVHKDFRSRSETRP